MLLIYDFKCKACDHTFESLENREEIKKLLLKCPNCKKKKATRIVSPIRFELDGTDPAFPTAYDRWGDMRSQRSKVAAKRRAEHGDEDMGGIEF